MIRQSRSYPIVAMMMVLTMFEITPAATMGGAGKTMELIVLIRQNKGREFNV